MVKKLTFYCNCAAVTQKYLIVTCNQAARRLGVTKLQGVQGTFSLRWKSQL